LTGKPDYTKVNATYQSNHVLNILAAERSKPVYAVLDEILREYFAEYFRKTRC
jgi:DNA gyrase/topoisomerase IV subunit A